MSCHAVVLSAGRGRRMGQPKHLLRVAGQPMLAHVVDALRKSQVNGVAVVLRPGDDEAAALVASLGAIPVFADDAEEGRAASIRAGVRSAPPDASLLFAMADQPFLVPDDFDSLIETGIEMRGGIVHASYGGSRGTPVLFGPTYRPELLGLRGSEGGRVVIDRHASDVAAVSIAPERGRDIDTPEDLPGGRSDSR